MFRLLKILFFLAFLAGTFFLFDRNSEPINIYFFKGDPIVAPGYLVIIIFVMIGVLLGYIISLRNLISYRSEMSSLIKKNKEISTNSTDYELVKDALDDKDFEDDSARTKNRIKLNI